MSQTARLDAQIAFRSEACPLKPVSRATTLSDEIRWRDHNATLYWVETRVGQPITRGAPFLSQWILPKMRVWFARNR